MANRVDSRILELRDRVLIATERKVLIARLSGSEQEKDISAPVNCGGYGRIRHFDMRRHDDWCQDPLPNVPAARAQRKSTPEEVLRTQLFQIAACNWRCWYCFVDDSRLSADLRVARHFTAGELVDMYLALPDRPYVLDLSGGYPDLVPEWCLWTMQALSERGAANSVFLWSDDNLSSRNLWEFLGRDELEYMVRYENYARVGCFKGYDEESFVFNTSAPGRLFTQQFAVFQDLLRLGFDMYAYVTFTATPNDELWQRMTQFMDRLQSIHPNLPLRTVPLKIRAFSPTRERMSTKHHDSLKFQYIVYEVWTDQLRKRFSEAERTQAICDVQLEI